MLSRDDIRLLLLPEVYLSFEKFAAMQHTADWAQVAQKAKRLVQQGKVTILRNAPHHVMAHVVGDGTDNGGVPDEHDVEISRHDPSSQIVEQWSCTCSLPGQHIVMADGSLKVIEDILVGDYVLDAMGSPRRVAHVMNRPYDGEIIGLRISGSSQTVWVTANHNLPDKDFRRVAASDWKQGDHTFLPAPVIDSEISKIDMSTLLPNLVEVDGWLYEPNKLYGSKRVRRESRPSSPIKLGVKPVPRMVSLDPQVVRMLGLYVAEGLVTPRGETRWHFGHDEESFADEVVEVLENRFGLAPNKKLTKFGWRVVVSSRHFSTLVKYLCGTGSHEKRLHPSLMAMPLSSLQSFFDGWVDGDGHLDKQMRWVLSTVSADLAMQARLILARLGRESVWRTREDNSSPLVPGGGSIHVVTWRNTLGKNHISRFYEDGRVYQRMLEPERRNYQGLVYNFEVEGTHTYVFAPGIASFNCKWAQYAFDRTRNFKRFEGRVCSHVLATYWRAKSTPLDLSDYNEGFQVPRGQKGAPGQQSIPGLFGPHVDTDQRSFSPDEEGFSKPPTEENEPEGVPTNEFSQTKPGPTPLKHNDELTMPKQPETPFGTEPKAQPKHEQLHLFDVTAPPGMQPTPMAPPVSVPGGRPATPGNPIAFPGTFSHFIPVLTLKTSEFILASDALTDYFETQRAARAPIYVTLTNLVTLELSGGKIPLPGAMPYGTSSEDVPLYRVLDLGYNPETRMRENADTNVLQGAPEQTGTYADVSPGRRGEVLDFDPNLKMAYVLIPLQYPDGSDARLHPMALKGWLDYADIKPAPRGISPWRSRVRR